jgi:hypothetical protein
MSCAYVKEGFGGISSGLGLGGGGIAAAESLFFRFLEVKGLLPLLDFPPVVMTAGGASAGAGAAAGGGGVGGLTFTGGSSGGSGRDDGGDIEVISSEGDLARLLVLLRGECESECSLGEGVSSGGGGGGRTK